jgi:protein O-mannosyl-transferase
MTSALTDKRLFTLVGLLLTLGTLWLYWPTTDFSFINFDDDEYISDNPVTRAGLTWHGLVWAFNGIHVANWHPLAWLSHMLDCQLFAVDAGGHHLMNVLFHIANTLLLFAFLRSATGALWRSAVVAALFAWHPQHVESVAWIAERKDVLSTFFWLLTIISYAGYANFSNAQNPKSKIYYPAALFFCTCALLSKPMAVTLPFTLLLLDFWPLNRIQFANFSLQNLKRQLLDKIPFFLLSFALCAVTFFAQRHAGAMSAVEFTSRLGNVPVAYARYLEKLFWPTDLAIIYPYVYRWPTLAIIGGALLVALISALAVRLLRRQPWMAVGWFWFLGTLVPVIGLVQVGAQSMADRYTYFPAIGLFIIVVWGVTEICCARAHGQAILLILGGGALTGCVLESALQISYWRNSTTLFLHAMEVTDNNYLAANLLGKAFENRGDDFRAFVLYREAVRIEPRYPISQYNLGLALIGFGKKDEAFPHLVAATRYDPDNADAQFNVGVYFLQEQHWPEAAQCFQAALRIRPDFASAHFRLGQALAQMKKFSESAAQLREALRCQKNFPAAEKELAALLAAHPELK